jgi:hypothetical protein
MTRGSASPAADIVVRTAAFLRYAAVAVAVAAPVTMGYIWFQLRDEADLLFHLMALSTVTLGPWWLMAIARQSVIVTADAMTVRNLIRTYRVPLADIEQVRSEPWGPGVVRWHDGREIEAGALDMARVNGLLRVTEATPEIFRDINARVIAARARLE